MSNVRLCKRNGGKYNVLFLELPDTSIADTSTEDLDSSQSKEVTAEVDNAVENSAENEEQTPHLPMEVGQ